jgi:tRNA(Ser,Leu) C12 N-acetylase TAN1
MTESIQDLVREHFDILARDEEIKKQVMETLVKEEMTEFFSVNWKKLHLEFIKRPSRQ